MRDVKRRDPGRRIAFIMFSLFIIGGIAVAGSALTFFNAQDPELYCVLANGSNSTRCEENSTVTTNNSEVCTITNGLCGLSNESWWNVSGNDLYPRSLSYQVGIGTDTPNTILDIVGNGGVTTADIQATSITGIAAWQVLNDAGHRGSFGIAGTENAIVSPSSFAIYQQGYNYTNIIVDGNKSIRFSTDETDAHGLAYTEKMRLTPDGSLGLGTSNPGFILDVVKEEATIIRSRLKNPSNDSSIVTGALMQVENGLGYWGGMGMTGNATTLQGGAFNNTFHIYNQGYADSLYTVDGNVSHVWYSNPSDAHNFAFSEIMRLRPDGNLSVKSFELTVPVEEDLRFPANVIAVQGVSNTPDWETFLGATQILSFAPSTMEQAFLSAQLPHGWKEGTQVEPHFHWSPSSTDTGVVVWCLEYTWANIGDTFPATSTECVVDAGTGTTNDHIISPTINISGVGKTFSSVLNMRIFRNATDTRDTYADDAGLLEFDIHYLNYRLGVDV